MAQTNSFAIKLIAEHRSSFEGIGCDISHELLRNTRTKLSIKPHINCKAFLELGLSKQRRTKHQTRTFKGQQFTK